ncbi:MAG: alpha-ketoacid dehydrogenase subunit beta [Rhodoglobus sp.]
MSDATVTQRTEDDALALQPIELSMQGALNLALRDALASDDRVLVFGEDVGVLGGVFRVTDGLQADFGADRVFDTPLAEAGIIGLGIGLAMAGWRPVAEIQFDGFVFPAYDQLVSQAARIRTRTRGAFDMPLTVRVPSFGGIRAPELHGESLETYFMHVPGLKVVTPSTPHDAYHLLRASIASPDPVIFMEPKSRYWNRGVVDRSRPDAIGARLVRPGKHVTLICWGSMVARCEQVAELAAEDGIEVEVLDLRWLTPLDEDAIARSVEHTRRAVIVHEAPLTAGPGAEIAALISSRCFRSLKAPVERVTGFDVPTPAGDLEDEFIPNIDRIMFGLQRVLEFRA